MRNLESSNSLMEQNKFEKLVIEALKDLPALFREKLENIEIVIEDYPSEEVRVRLGKRSSGAILGLYQGVPLKRRGSWYGNVLPDRIILYREVIEALAPNEEALPEIVRRVVLHEIGHYFGLSEWDLRKLQY